MGQPGPQGRQVSERRLGWAVGSTPGHLICLTLWFLRAPRGSRGLREFQDLKACPASRETRYQMAPEKPWERARRHGVEDESSHSSRASQPWGGGGIMTPRGPQGVLGGEGAAEAGSGREPGRRDPALPGEESSPSPDAPLSPGLPRKDRAPRRSGEYQRPSSGAWGAPPRPGVGGGVVASQPQLRLLLLHLQGDPGVAGLPGEKGEKVSGLRGGGRASGGCPGPPTW